MKKHGRFLSWTLSVLVILPFLWPQEAKPRKVYTVSGERHGVSYFPAVDYPETRPKVVGEMNFQHYHTYEEVVSFLKKWEKEYPDLVDLYSVGKSFEGRDIWQITVTNKSTGKDTDKPAMFLEGNRHSGEVTAGESALYFAWHVLSNYGKDPGITHLVDTKALYIRVKNNLDGSELYLNTAQSNRSTVRPHDSDGDGKITDLEVLRWNDEALGGKGFKNWEPFAHPQLGEVEIGGFNPKFFRQNPPATHLEEWARKQVMFNLILARSLPQVRIASAEAKPVRKEANTYELACVFTNEGFLPTALEIAKRVKIVRPDSAEILLSDGIELVSGKQRVDIGYLKSKEKREVRWKVKMQETAKGDIEIMIRSTRGGVDKKTVSLKGRK